MQYASLIIIYVLKSFKLKIKLIEIKLKKLS